MLINLSCDSIGDLDAGIARQLINREIDRAVADLEDRGEEDGKPRKVIIQLELETRDGLVVATAVCEAKLPPRRSGATAASMRMRQRGSEKVSELCFQDLNADNPDQPTIHDFEDSEPG